MKDAETGTCEEVRANLAELVFGEPDDGQAMRWNLHLAECPACRAEEERLLALHAAVRGAGEKVDPEGEAARAGDLERLRARMRVTVPAPRPVPFWRQSVPAWAAAVACAVALLLGLRWPLLSPGGVGAPGRAPAFHAVASAAPGFETASAYDTGIVVAGSGDSARAPDPAPRPERGDSL